MEFFSQGFAPHEGVRSKDFTWKGLGTSYVQTTQDTDSTQIILREEKTKGIKGTADILC